MSCRTIVGLYLGNFPITTFHMLAPDSLFAYQFCSYSNIILLYYATVSFFTRFSCSVVLACLHYVNVFFYINTKNYASLRIHSSRFFSIRWCTPCVEESWNRYVQFI